MEKYYRWLDLSQELRSLKAEESKLRTELCNDLFSEYPGIDIVKIELEDGTEVKAKKKLNRSIDERVLNNIWDKLSPTEMDAVKFKSSLIASKYRDIPDNSLLNEAVTVKLGRPTLEVKIGD